MSEIDSLHDQVCNTLEPHIVYATGGYDEDTRHFLPVEFLEALGWLAVCVVLPVLTNIASSLLTDVFKRKASKPLVLRCEGGARIHTKGKRGQKEERSPIISVEEIQEAIPEIKRVFESCSSLQISEEAQIEAQYELSDFLVANGWPSDIAQKDANTVVINLVQVMVVVDRKR